MTITALLILGALVGVLLSAYFSAAETGLYTLNPVRVAVESQQNVRGARQLAQVLRREDELVTVTLVGANVADYIHTACLATLFLRAAFAPSTAELYTTLIATPVILVFGAIIPKDYVRRNPEPVMRLASGPLLACGQLLRWSGARWLLQRLTRLLLRGIDPAHANESEHILTRARTLSLLREGAASGGLSPYQQDIIDRIMRLTHVNVSAVMIPRARAATVAIDIPRDDFLRIARMAHFARYPVWEHNKASVRGMVAVIDVITDEQPRPIRDYVREVVRLPGGISITGALLRLQEARQPMAVVIDRNGDCVGILTVKDLVEEIVGDIEVW